MWLNAFIPKSASVQKNGVPNVPGVPPSFISSSNASSVALPAWNITKVLGVPDVPLSSVWNTLEHSEMEGCSNAVSTFECSLPRELSISGTLGTPGTHQKCNSAEHNAGVSNLVCEFMEIDGLSLADAQALAAESVPRRSESEWLMLIAEHDLLIRQYCIAMCLNEEGKKAILAVSRRQSLASITKSLAWFRFELSVIEAKMIKRQTS
ncbi:MAG: hypothetical protein ACEQSE_00175 [Candidatus Aquirickettsiella gammari]